MTLSTVGPIVYCEFNFLVSLTIYLTTNIYLRAAKTILLLLSYIDNNRFYFNQWFQKQDLDVF